MIELIAEGSKNQHSAWRALPEGHTFVLGRAPRTGLRVPWDPLISREHAQISVQDGRLAVHQLASARNPIFLAGHEAKDFTVAPHGEFSIGTTKFRFECTAPATPAPAKVIEHTLSGGGAAVNYGNAQACLQTLCEMPSLIATARDDADFASRVVELLLKSLPNCLAVAVVQFEPEALGDGVPQPKLIRWNSRDTVVSGFSPSRRLMDRAFQQQESVVHLWSPDARAVEYTMASDLDWAFCTPIPTGADEKWCLYVSGRRKFIGLPDVQSPEDLLSDLRLAELMAKFIGAVRQVRALEKHQAELRQFLSPAVVEALMSCQGTASLDPHEGPVAVLFCDVRGFSRMVEQSQGQLERLLGRVREALSVMTRSILKYEGVVADFQGDSALGFWGWPTVVQEAPLSACRAALLIHNTFLAAQQDANHPLNGFHVGIGVGYGTAIAGRIGSDEQTKVGVFGPVVNLTSRLQELTKVVGTPMLLEGGAATAVAVQLPPDEGMLRRIGRVRPRGVSAAIDVFALQTPAEAAQFASDGAQSFDAALAAVEAGQWEEARTALGRVSAAVGPARFLKQAIDDYGGHPPADWDGVLALASKESARLTAV
jgi:adenylate cyclase